MLQQTVVDTLSAALMRMKLKASNAAAIDAGPDWTFKNPGHTGFAFHLLLKGELWLAIEGERHKHHLRAGDCMLMTGGRPFVLTNSPKAKAKKLMDADAMLTHYKHGMMKVEGGGQSLSLGTQFLFDGHFAKVAFARFPATIHIRADANQNALLRWTLERFKEEFLGHDAGRSLVISHLAPIMLLQALRAYLHTANKDKNWLVALCDPKLSKAIEAIHTHYKRAWTLEQLAQVAGMSRSRFALYFKQQIGVSPIDYLTQWRMQIACDLLEEEGQGIAAIAIAVGYASESAFSVAFTKALGIRPGAYKQRNTGAIDIRHNGR